MGSEARTWTLVIAEYSARIAELEEARDHAQAAAAEEARRGDALFDERQQLRDEARVLSEALEGALKQLLTLSTILFDTDEFDGRFPDFLQMDMEESIDEARAALASVKDGGGDSDGKDFRGAAPGSPDPGPGDIRPEAPSALACTCGHGDEWHAKNGVCGHSRDGWPDRSCGCREYRPATPPAPASAVPVEDGEAGVRASEIRLDLDPATLTADQTETFRWLVSLNAKANSTSGGPANVHTADLLEDLAAHGLLVVPAAVDGEGDAGQGVVVVSFDADGIATFKGASIRPDLAGATVQVALPRPLLAPAADSTEGRG